MHKSFSLARNIFIQVVQGRESRWRIELAILSAGRQLR